MTGSTLNDFVWINTSLVKLPSTTTTNATNACPISSNTTNNQMIKSRRRTMTKSLFNTDWRLWGRRSLCQGWLNLDRGYCYIFTLLYFYFSTFPPPLPNCLVPRTHGYTCSHPMTHLFPYLWLLHLVIYDFLTIIRYDSYINDSYSGYINK